VFQILNGSLKSDGYSEDKYFKCEKFDRSLELIEENDKIAVICRHTLELERFRDTIKDRRVFILNGQTPKEERDKLIQEFNNSDKCVILIQAKVCEGYNLYTPVMMFYSMDWGLVEWTQMIGRPVRLDNLKSVVYINLVYKDTVDEAVYENVVIKKQEFQSEIYKHLI
jgi:superfamily II DNA or RNA helicase